MVGEVLETLEEAGLADNTLLIFTSDNGGMLNQGGQDAYAAGHRMNDGLLGFKFDAWEGGHRVPLIARWPGKVSAGSVSNALFSNVDFLATVADLTGYPLKENEGPDSYSMLPVLTGSVAQSSREYLIISPNSPENISIRKGKWMYISEQGGGGFMETNVGDHTFGGPAAFPFTGQKNSDIKNGEIVEDAPPAQLYDLENDPAQSKNVYRKYPEVVAQMEKLLETAIK